MKLNEMVISNHEAGMQDALEATEKLGEDCGLGKKQILHLRLLAEELFGMTRSIAGKAEGQYWVEQEGSRFEIHFNSEVDMTKEKHKRFIDVSTSGENAAAKGFMGKLRNMIALSMLPKEERASMLSMGLIPMDSPSGTSTENVDFMWSMNQYKSTVNQNRSTNEQAKEAWDELEKSIVSSLADEVIVHIVGSLVDITIIKTVKD